MRGGPPYSSVAVFNHPLGVIGYRSSFEPAHCHCAGHSLLSLVGRRQRSERTDSIGFFVSTPFTCWNPIFVTSSRSLSSTSKKHRRPDKEPTPQVYYSREERISYNRNTSAVQLEIYIILICTIATAHIFFLSCITLVVEHIVILQERPISGDSTVLLKAGRCTCCRSTPLGKSDQTDKNS